MKFCHNCLQHCHIFKKRYNTYSYYFYFPQFLSPLYGQPFPSSTFGTVHYHFSNFKKRTSSWSANSIQPRQTAYICMLA